jgi:hypothetical protein
MIRHPISAPAFEIPEEDIQKCAYHLWLEAGRPAGRDLEFWDAARERLRHAAQTTHSTASPSSRRHATGQKVRTAGQEARS